MLALFVSCLFSSNLNKSEIFFGVFISYLAYLLTQMKSLTNLLYHFVAKRPCGKGQVVKWSVTGRRSLVGTRWPHYNTLAFKRLLRVCLGSLRNVGWFCLDSIKPGGS